MIRIIQGPGTPRILRTAEGAAGLSAFEIARNAGFEGTEAEWLASLAAAAFPTNGATLTESDPLFSLGQTWNNAAETFLGGLVNITRVAAGVASAFLAFQLDDVDQFRFGLDGDLYAAGGAAFGEAVTIAGQAAWHAGTFNPGDYLPVASYTAVDVFAKVLSQDGPASGLSAQFLGGQDGDYYRDASHLTGTVAAARLPAFTGDATAPAGSAVLTLADVNANAGSWGSATKAAAFTTNAKGQVIAAGEFTVTPAWGAIVGPPTTAAGYGLTDVVTLAGDQIVAGNKTFSGNFTIGGDLVVQGDTVTLNTSTLDVEDAIISVGKGNTGAASWLGLKAERGASDAFLVWNETTDLWSAYTSADDLATPVANGFAAARFVATAGSLAASAPSIDVTQTWNGAGVVFTALKLNVTDTASNVGSFLADLQVAGVSKFSVNKAGSMTLGADLIATGGSATIAGGGVYRWNGRSAMGSSADGIVTLYNAALTDFSRLNGGGVTAAFPSWARSAAGWVARLADNSGDTWVQASQFLAGDGSAGAPSIGFAGLPTSGFYNNSGTPSFSRNGVLAYQFGVTTFVIDSTSGAIRFGSDVIQTRDAANVWALRNGTAAQAIRAYGTWTDPSNYERGFFEWSSNVLEIGTLHNGTGSARAMRLKVGAGYGIKFATTSTDRWEINGNGHFVSALGNTYDFGTPSLAARTGYFGTSVIVGAAGATLTIPDGVGTAQAGQMFAAPTSGFAAVVAGVHDGARYRRAALFVDDTNGVWGLSATYSSTAPDFVIRMAATEFLRIRSDGGIGIGGAPSGHKVDLQAGTSTTQVSALRSLQTWNNAGVVFTHRLSNVTDTASHANSLLQDWQVSGVSKLSVRKDGAISSVAGYQAYSATAIPAGGTAGAGFRFSSTANFGVFFGSGAPTLAAGKGSLYLRSDGSGTGDRAYINTDGGTTWTALTTAA